MASTQHKAGTETPVGGAEPALHPPSKAAIGADWHECVVRAKSARELGRKTREGKPITFRLTRNLNFGRRSKDSGRGPVPDRTPLYEAQHSPRYERQRLIGEYEDAYQCRLVVLIDALFPDSVNLFEETLYDADPSQDLHVMLSTPGGDGETAIRLIRQAQAHCKELTVVVPNQAKSAGTLFVLGADHIILGPTSDLGPIDPQFRLPDGSLAAGKAIIAAVEDAEQRVTRNPDTFPLHASLLSDISALMVQQARDALARTNDQLTEALGCVSGRNKANIRKLASSLGDSLIGKAQSHATTVSAQDAAQFGLPVKAMASSDRQWQEIWRLWTKYVAMGAVQAYEGRTASVVLTPEDYRELAGG